MTYRQAWVIYTMALAMGYTDARIKFVGNVRNIFDGSVSFMNYWVVRNYEGCQKVHANYVIENLL